VVFRDPHQKVRVLDVDHDMLFVRVLGAERDAEFPGQLPGDAPRDAAALDDLVGIGDLEDARGGHRLEPRRGLGDVGPGIGGRSMSMPNQR
jgi:hypothetical protein